MVHRFFRLSPLSRPLAYLALRATGPARWPEFAPAALDNGIEALFAFPSTLGSQARRPGPLFGRGRDDLTPVGLDQA